MLSRTMQTMYDSYYTARLNILFNKEYITALHHNGKYNVLKVGQLWVQTYL